jgi:hypothetical protein
MKLRALFEMPQYVNKEIPTLDMGEHKPFYTQRSMSEKYNILATTPYYVGISKDGTFGFIGEAGNRADDNAPGAFILGSIEFKSNLNISSLRHLLPNKKVLQVDGVEVSKLYNRRGIGYYLYFTLIQAGYVVISDNLQYMGGKAIWKKIAAKTISNQYKVYVMQDMKVLMQDNKPIVYDSNNIDDCEIW